MIKYDKMLIFCWKSENAHQLVLVFLYHILVLLPLRPSLRVGCQLGWAEVVRPADNFVGQLGCDVVLGEDYVFEDYVDVDCTDAEDYDVWDFDVWDW